MAYVPQVNADTLTLYLGLAATGKAVAGSTTLSQVSFGNAYFPRPDITFRPSDVGMPIAIVGGGPVDPLMPPIYFVQGAMFHTTIAAYVSPTEVTLADAPDTSIFNTGYATVILYRPCPFASDVAATQMSFQFSSSIAPGTNDTLQFSVLNSLGGTHNPYIDRFGPIKLGQPVYLTSSDPDVGDIFGGYIDSLTASSYPGVTEVYSWGCQCASWAALANRRVVSPPQPQSFDGVAGDVVFKRVVLDYLSDEGVSVTAQSAPNITLACPVGSVIGQLLDQIVSLISTADTAWYWTTDIWRKFILTTRTAATAPWNVSDGSDLFTGDTPYQQSITETHNQLANEVYALGNSTLLNALQATFTGNGVTRTFQTPQPVGAAPTITLNGGAQVVGVLGVDSGADWYWAQSSTTITQDPTATILLPTDSLVVAYLTPVAAVAQAPNGGSQQQNQAVEASSAHYEHSISISQPIMPNDLLAIAAGYEIEYGYPAQTCQLYTLRPGLKAGQLQTIDLADAGISGTFLVATVQMTLKSNVIVWQYTAFGGANIGNAITALTQFINRGQATLSLLTPTVAITSSSLSSVAVQQSNEGSYFVNVVMPGDVAEGNLLVVVAVRDAYLGNPPAINDTLGNTWTQAAWCQGPAIPPYGGHSQVSILWAIANSSGPDTISMPVVGADGPSSFYVFEFNNVLLVSGSPVDAASPDTSSSAVPTLTISGDDLIITGLVAPGTGATATSPEVVTAFNADASPNPGCAVAAATKSAAGSFTSSLVPVGGANYAYASVAFRLQTAPPAQSTSVLGNPQGTVTHSVGDLTSGLPVIGHGGGDITVGTKTGVTSDFVTAAGSPVTGAPLVYGSTGDAVAGVTGQLVPSGGVGGQVLAKNSATNYDTHWITGGGGGGGTTTLIGPIASLPGSGTTTGDTYICLDSPYEFVWDGSVWQAFVFGYNVTQPILANFTQANVGELTIDSTHGGLVLSVPNGGSSNNVQFLTQPIPGSGAYYVDCAFLLLAQGTNGGVGSGLANGSNSGAALAFNRLGAESGNFYQWEAQYFNNASSWSSNQSAQTFQSFGPLTWTRMYDDGSSTRYFYMSMDGYHWTLFRSEGRTSFLTPTVGMFALANYNSALAAHLLHFSIHA